MKILVTGGAGFIGSALIRYIINNTFDSVINVDKLTYAGNLESLTDVIKSDRYNFECADICDNTAMYNIFKKYQPNAVMHLAAESHVDRSIINPSVFIKTNIMGTYVLLETSLKYWSNLNNKNIFSVFHHISTDEVYGDISIFNNKNGCKKSFLFNEETAYSPSNPYSASKASGNHLVKSWLRTYNLPIIITNCSNNYGPYQFPEKLIPLIISNALEGKSLPIYGKGNQIRDWIYVEDHVRALYKVITKGKIGETYNISGHNEKRNIDVVFNICTVLDKILPKKKSYFNQVIYVKDRPGHDYHYAINSNKIELELNWKPKETFESGIRKTIEWYISNIKWLKKIKKRNSNLY